MDNAGWRKIIASSADPQRAQHFLDQLKSTQARSLLKRAKAGQARILVALLSGSEALSEWLVAHPEWLASLDADLIQKPRQKQGFHREVHQWLQRLLQTNDYASALNRLREFKQREMLRIAARDLARLGNVTEITRELSDLADVCLDTTYQVCWQQLTQRLGIPYHQDAQACWQRTGFCVLGMGKLGGQELNYSSDVDLLFVYSEEGFPFKEPPQHDQSAGKGFSNHEFFLRLAELYIAELSRLATEGNLFRVDMRLRPEGNAGPLVRSVSSYENYYAQWGQTWERMMLIKARAVSGDAALASEFFEMIQPFRYPRSMSERLLHDVGAMKQRIETEIVRSGELERNVKLGRGGIREIEFIVQMLQLLHAGRIPFLQDSQTLPALQKLVRYTLLSAADSETLATAYCFLRDVEHRLQMENNLQTHTIPTERRPRERLAALMGFATLAEFESAHREFSQTVRKIYDALLKGAETRAKPALPDFAEGQMEWRQILAAHSFREPERAWQLLREFVQGPGYVHVSPRTSELAMELVPKILALCPRTTNNHLQSAPIATAGGRAERTELLSDPDRVLTRLDSFVSAYGSRALLYETWISNPSLFRLILLLFDRSEFLAEIAISTPDLVDELELSGRLRRRKTTDEILRDLRYGIDDADQKLWIRRYHQAELMRIGLRDILGLADFEQNLVELTALAEACLQYAAEIVARRYKFKRAPFAVLGLGKLGGAELNYGSDLDIIFVADSKQRNLPQLQRVATEMMDLLSSPTALGVAFATDARLRPDGEKGLLVNTLAAYEEYYRQRAHLWEIQSLSRCRTVAGNHAIGERFEKIAAVLTNFREPSQPLAAYRPNWKEEIHRMRLRIEKERTPPGKQRLAIKTGAGGLIDAEFIAQTLSLAQGWREPNTLRGLNRALETKVLDRPDAEKLIEAYRKLRRVEGVLRRWSYASETVLPDDPAPLYRVAIRCGFTNADTFLLAVDEYRVSIRSVYLKVMSG